MVDDIWGKFNGCRKLANRIVNNKEVFRYLDAPQLLKHFLGLKTDYGDYNFELFYLWYKIDSREAIYHEKEIKRFKKYTDFEINLHVVTYQELFQRVKVSCGIEHNKYLAYMEKRYF
jgi:hypothetical protein